MNPTLSVATRLVQVQVSANRTVAFCDTNRATIAMGIHTHGAFFAMIQAMATAALDGGNLEQALTRIDLVARQAAADADALAEAVGSISTITI